jgi:hypothetical protein
MLQHHYPTLVLVLHKICKIPLYSCNRLLIRRKTLTSEEVWVLGRDISQRKSNLENRVDVPAIHSADPLIFPLPKHFCGQVHCPDERWFFLLQTGSFLSIFFRLVWLKDLNNIPRLLIYPFQDNQFTRPIYCVSYCRLGFIQSRWKNTKDVRKSSLPKTVHDTSFLIRATTQPLLIS